ncbi:hypothetical protein TNCT_328511 [Trichonephila clavata]|uniref:Uncharacterized protein n=1 Tax=Trichonephila clavata TaxID=2740835 RepID=A0A8X6HR70_TRICU|nr:hypothetical protein TNCT_328511 [Trichonephila clavata]
MEGEFAETTNQLSNTWTLAKQASRHQQVTWTFNEGPGVAFGDECFMASKRGKVIRAFHGNYQLQETTNLLETPTQGKVMDCVAMSPTS